MGAAERSWVTVVITGDVALAGWELTRAPAGAGNGSLLLLAALLACAAVCIEAARRLELPAGGARDLLSAWCLPAALLLPVWCALVAPALAIGLLQARLSQRGITEAAFRAATLGLAGAAASSLSGLLGVAGRGEWFTDAARLAGAVACAGVFALVTATVTAVAAHLRDPLAGWRELLRDSENLLLDVSGLCVGFLVTIACSLSPALLVVALPPVVLLQRGLLHQHLRAAARTDPKTGLLHAVAWQREADAAIRRAVRSREPLAVLLADIDHFKRVNDTHGHLAGDRVLLATSEALRRRVRGVDLLGRFGGEEFVVLLPGTAAAEACRVAERLRQEVGALSVRTAGSGGPAVTVTVSIGVAALDSHGNELLELLTAADAALYRAKTAGRDQVCLQPPSGRASDPRA
jgi:diguanylate cyclase (GGDEF)-like protein